MQPIKIKSEVDTVKEMLNQQWRQDQSTKNFQESLEKDRVLLLEQCETLSISSPVDTTQILSKLNRAYQIRQILKQITS